MDSSRVIPLVERGVDGVQISLQRPQTRFNFLLHNKCCSALDVDYLMQPVNEAMYDSETQACVDRNTGGPASFYDHYQRKPTKKKGVAIGCECPLSYRNELTAEDLLQVPPEKDLPPSGVPRSALADFVVRRLATGRMPPKEDVAPPPCASEDEFSL